MYACELLPAFGIGLTLTPAAKHNVDTYIKQIGLPAVFVLTGTFYENMIYRNHATYVQELDMIEFRHPVINGDTKCRSADPSTNLIDGW